MKRAAVMLDGVVYMGAPDRPGARHMDALWTGIRALANLTPEDHVGGLKGEARKRRDVVCKAIDSGKVACVFGFAELDGSAFEATDGQEGRKRLYL